MPNIKPVSDLRNYSEVLRDIAVGKPVFLTEDGQERYVIMDICDYEEAQKVNYLISELVKNDPSSEGDAIAALEAPYVSYSMQGLNNLKISQNRKMSISHPLVKSVSIQDELKCFALELNKGIQYVEHKAAIDLYAFQLFFSLVVQTDVDIDQPQVFLCSDVDGDRKALIENVCFDESATVFRKDTVDNVYQRIKTAPPAFDKYRARYERILSTLQNPNLVVQFISLYELLMELLAQKSSLEYPSQRSVSKYFSQNSKKYPDVKFRKTRKKDQTFEEDSFTYLRNELAHCEKTSDMILYHKLGSSITCQTIKQLTRAINDVIIEMRKPDETANP
jgi:hypothetical protein